MKLFSFRELLDAEEALSEKSDIERYAIEMADGWRMWMTLFPVLVLGLAGSWALKWLSWKMAILYAFAIPILPTIMTFGYLSGAFERGFPARTVFRIAFRRLKEK